MNVPIKNVDENWWLETHLMCDCLRRRNFQKGLLGTWVVWCLRLINILLNPKWGRACFTSSSSSFLWLALINIQAVLLYSTCNTQPDIMVLLELDWWVNLTRLSFFLSLQILHEGTNSKWPMDEVITLSRMTVELNSYFFRRKAV